MTLHKTCLRTRLPLFLGGSLGKRLLANQQLMLLVLLLLVLLLLLLLSGRLQAAVASQRFGGAPCWGQVHRLPGAELLQLLRRSG